MGWSVQIPSAGRDAAVGTFAVCRRPTLAHNLSEVCIWGRTRQEESQAPVLSWSWQGTGMGAVSAWGLVFLFCPAELLHGAASAAEIPAPCSPLPSLEAFGVLDFVHTLVPGSQAGRSCSERVSKATLSCLLPAPCLEHTLVFLLPNGSCSSLQPEHLELQSAAAPCLSCGIRMLSAAALSAPWGQFIFQGAGMEFSPATFFPGPV